MPVNRADVVEAELLEDGGGHHHALGVYLQLLGQLEQRRCVAQHLFGAFARGGVKAPGHQAGQMAVERAHRRRDRHVVVVEHHQHVGHLAVVRHARVVHGLEGHAGSHRAVADDGDRLAFLALELRTQGHAQRCRNRGGRVGRAEGVVHAFVATREAAHAAVLAQRGHAVAAAGQDLVWIGLMTDVPDQAVIRRVEHVMQRDGELDRAQVGRQVAARAGNAVQQKVPQFVGQLLQLGARQVPDVGGLVDPGQQGVAHGVHILGGLFGVCQWSRWTMRSARSRSVAVAVSPSPLRWSAALASLSKAPASWRAPSRPSKLT